MKRRTGSRRHMWLSSLAAVTLAVLFAAPSSTQAYPEPEVVSPSWQLDFTWQKPRPIAIEGEDGNYRWFWYMPYKVVNNTGDEVLFIPEITIATDTGRIMPAGRDVPASLFPKIKNQLGNPLLESPIEVVGEMLQGVDHAKESVAVWPAASYTPNRDDVDELRVFFAGLSGESTSIDHPATGEPVMMRRTLMLRFELPGNPRTPQDQPVVHAGTREVMR